MSSQFIDLNAPSLQGKLPKLPHELPHGLIVPPAIAREWLEKERAKHSAEAFARAEVQLLNNVTLQYYFDDLGHDVLYRVTPQGPEVLAVGFDEIFAYRRATPCEEQVGVKIWLPY